MVKVLIDNPIEGIKVLTTEEGKLYNLYVLNEDGSYEGLDSDISTSVGKIWDNYRDHCFNPLFVKEVAKQEGFYITKEFMEHVVEEWVECFFWAVEDNRNVTTYWGNVAIIKEVEDGYIVSYTDPVTDVDTVRGFTSLNGLDNWLISIHSPSYAKIRDWHLKYENKPSAWRENTV